MFPTTAGAGGDGGDDCPQEIINDEKFFSRLLSKELSAANPSFRVYYGGASGSVPFLWESQPGTPKHAAAAAALPPLAPPPSSYFNSSQPSGKSSPKSSKLKLLHAILPRIALRKPPLTSPSASSSSGRSSSDEEENDEAKMSPTSTLCFGDRLALKKAILSVVGFGSGSGHGPGRGGSA